MESPTITPSAAAAALERALDYSAYAQRLVHADPALRDAAALCEPWTRQRLLAEFPTTADLDEGTLRRRLRRLRQRVMLNVMARDLGGHASLGEVTGAMTLLAEVGIQVTLDFLYRELAARHGEPVGQVTNTVQQLHVVGMGKLGGGELNVSSDIDLIYVYPEDGSTNGERSIENQEFFNRLARQLGVILSEHTEDGYVFRVDARLRPYGDSGPLTVSFDMLENYLITQGREWERYAWIKGRSLTGNRSAELARLVRPFVFRRHLDYSAFASMRDLHAQVRREVERRDIADNIKLGPGGIREIEFTVQVFQLIRGGRDEELRRQPTREVLALLEERRLLPAATVKELDAAYLFLRNLEHRLQYRDDKQTHALPRDEAEREHLARSMSFADYAALRVELDRHRDNVNRHFSEIFAASEEAAHPLAPVWQEAGSESDPAPAIALLGEAGYRRPAAICQRLAAMHNSPRYRQMPAVSQTRLDRLIPLALEVASRQKEPDVTAERVLQLMESIARREAYLALLEQYPQALARLADLMSASPWVAEYVTRYPILLDELLDSRTLYEPPDWPSLRAQLRRNLDAAAGDTERQMDLLRHFKHVQTLRLVAQDLSGALTLEKLADHLSDLACEILTKVVQLCWEGLRQQHRPQPAFAVIAYGKLGGKELGYASDLDLVFLYDDPAPEAPENYARLAQRINRFLTTLTSGGLLYETDLRLRPDGASGLLVSPLESFREYQEKHAWLWEHQALTRARYAAGDAAIGRAFEEIRCAVLRTPRDLTNLQTEVTAMRQKMFDGHPNRSALFDLKHDRGGLIDVEFVVQYLVLGHSHVHAELTGNIGNLALLKLAADLGLLDPAVAEPARIAYRHFRRLQHELRLQGGEYARVDPDSVAAHVRAVKLLWNAVFGETAAV